MTEPAILINNLSRNFGTLKAVDNLNLDIPQGEIFCFLGPNGAGKTTTIKILTGLVKPTSGTALIGGFDIQKNPVEAKKIIGYIPDMPYLYDRLTPIEFMRLTADLYRLDRKKADSDAKELLGTFSLLEAKSSLIKDLSHGMRQRLLYAATFLHSPSVLFIDEPLIGLDPYTIRAIKNILVAKSRGGMTIFLTTHILWLAQDIADRIGIIHKGKLVALGTLDELKSNFETNLNLEDIFLKLTANE